MDAQVEKGERKGRQRLLTTLIRDQRGGMVVMGAVVMMTLSVVVFAAVEFHHVTSVRSRLQTAMDSATLAAAKSGKRTPPDLKAVGLPVFTSNLGNLADISRLQANDVRFHRAAGSVTGQAKLCVRRIISGMIGGAQSCVFVKSAVLREAMALEVVLVLDNSGSMSARLGGQTRIQALEAAARGFIDKLQQMDDPDLPDDVRIGIVPFAGSVKLDPVHRTAWWIDADGRSSLNSNLFHSWERLTSTGNSAIANPKRFAYFDALGVGWAGCVESRHGDYALSDAAPDLARPDSLFVPYFAPDEIDWDTGLPGGHAPPPVHYPNDYIEDTVDGLPISPPEKGLLYRDHWDKVIYGHEKYTSTNPIRTSAHQATPHLGHPAINVAARVASNDMGPNRWCQTRAVTPLNTGFDDMKAALNNTPLARHTNIPHALVWGWHVLSPNAPFANGKPYGERGVRKVLVLMTDGDNLVDPPGGSAGEDSEEDRWINRNESYYGVYGYIWRSVLGVAARRPTTVTAARAAALASEAEVTTALNTRMRTLCDRMKADSVGITIFAVQFAQGGAADPNLTHCATSAEHFKNANQAQQLDQAFQQIADDISLLRIAR